MPEEAAVTTDSGASKNIKVLMVDDHEIMRQAYGMLLNTDPDIEIVGFAGDGQEALVLADTLGPNVVIMDGRMPRLNGVDAARIIREKHPDMAIVLLSAFDDDEFVREFLKGNVRGKAYLLKQSLQSLSDLVQAVKDVAEGKTYLASEIVAKLAGTQNSRESQFLSELTEREREVLDCMARGLSNAAIAEELFIQPRTVERHIGSIFSKMRLQPQPKAHARVQAVLAYLSDTGRLKEGSKAGEGDDSMIGAIGMMG
ncbi:response regulator [Candidatus Lucifugimonas marina]|jgi:DNA-binding NarL/FixJ family response regulator|uniref:Response regulator n=1 Tax=Candidatus Lucifugimonas marina TaxID=3038979 RepID=A0AAJ5ZHN2_9CHLR|nr:response regulator [SAR202 cluster bacterium JH702]MDG0868457.1 response regulator [SAR202 cluster bacterium JH639]WFG35090.1 response regulator [SAR202 cluster bacterium JH545]WFG39047.1 response regulator [SAR202 cluster bacterium JH1073]